MEMKNTPKLRFPGFTYPWEQRKLGDIATITGGGTPSTNISEYWNGDIDWYSPVEIGEKRYASGSIRKITKLGLEKSSAKILPVGTVLFTSRAGIGNTAILQVEGCTNQGFQSITPNSKELDTYFLYTMTPKLKRYGEVTGAGSTFVEVSGKQMEQMNLMIPSLDEQKHVSQLFKVMDDAITLHQRKLEHLKLKKKSLLQKLFPKEGEVYPELRFPGFTDPWEQHKLGDYLIQYTEITTQNNQYPVLTSSRKGLFFQTDYYDGNQIASKDNTGYNIVPYGYFTYRHMSDDEIFHFNINYIVDKGIVSTLYPVFTTKNLNSNFLQLQLNYGNEFRKYAVLLKQGGSRTYMYFNKLKNLNLTISTSIGEQEIIAKFFILFEKLITLHQRKLEHLQLLKKALLQQLFV